MGGIADRVWRAGVELEAWLLAAGGWLLVAGRRGLLATEGCWLKEVMGGSGGRCSSSDRGNGIGVEGDCVPAMNFCKSLTVVTNPRPTSGSRISPTRS